MPPAAPAREEIKREAAGNIVTIIDVPATPRPRAHANHYAKALALCLAPRYRDAVRAKYDEIAKATGKA